jgi:hypothetical protein
MFSIATKKYSWYILTPALTSSLVKREFGAVGGIHGDGKKINEDKR